MEKSLSKIGKYYGIAHAVGCPSHGLVGLALKLGLALPLGLTTLLQYPHDLITHKIFEPAWRYVLNEGTSKGSSCDHNHEHHHPHSHSCPNSERVRRERPLDTDIEPRASRYAHLTTDVTGWGAFCGFIFYSGYKRFRKKKERGLGDKENEGKS